MILIRSMLSPDSSNDDCSFAHPETADLASQSNRQKDEDSLTIAKTHDTAKEALSTPAKANSVSSRLSPWLAFLAYPLGRYGLLPFYFRRIEVFGRENLPSAGPVILAPTHRSRWDAFMVPYAAGQDITGRTLRFMVSADEVKGVQGWFIRRLGGFPINTKRPAVASLRHSVELLQKSEVLVIFPEGGDLRGNRSCYLNQLQPGLARLALQSELSQANLGIQIVPINIAYSSPSVPWRSRVRICIGAPLKVADYAPDPPKPAAKRLTADLAKALKSLNDCTAMRDKA
jgi:1-acyl-sn-glycerol-3-phosphate acyltransferase